MLYSEKRYYSNVTLNQKQHVLIYEYKATFCNWHEAKHII